LLQGRRLLILDDDPLVGLLIESVARLAGAQTCLTHSHDSFFAALADWAPSHIVLDLTLPGMPGEAVLQALAQRGCGARIIVASGAEPQRLAAAAQQAAAAALDVAGTLNKPFAPAALRALLL
jgi:CheY-like chemotaxis protein